MAKRSALPARLTRERQRKGWSQKELAKRIDAIATGMGATMPERASLIRSIKNWESGAHHPRDPYPMLLARAFEIDEDEMLAAEALWPEENADRLRYVAEAPRRLDPAVMGALADVLAGQRRAEDTIGSAPLIGVVTEQLSIVESLVIESRGDLRAPMLDVAAQWTQFAGWLNANSTRAVQANRWYDRALEWATESGDRDRAQHEGTPRLDRRAGGAVDRPPLASRPDFDCSNGIFGSTTSRPWAWIAEQQEARVASSPFNRPV